MVQEGLVWLYWPPSDHILYTEAELRKLDMSFGNPSARALAEFLRRARPDASELHGQMEEIVKERMSCSRMCQGPRRFKLSIGTEEHRFNNILAVDIVKVDGHNTLVLRQLYQT